MVYATNDKKDYVEALDSVLKALNSFDRCEYAINNITQQEFMRVLDRFGAVAYFDITGMTCSEILKDVCKVVLLDQARLAPDSLITDIRKKRKIADMFRR